MSDIINDGTLQWGSRDLTINGVVYTADDFKWDQAPGADVLRTDKQSKPTGQAMSRGVITGSATLQLSGPSITDDIWGLTFVTPGPAGTNITCIITNVGRSEGKGAETKVAISFKKAITGTVTAS